MAEVLARFRDPRRLIFWAQAKACFLARVVIFLAVLGVLFGSGIQASPAFQMDDPPGNGPGFPTGSTTRKVFDKQSFPWYDSAKEEFVPIKGQKAPEKKKEETGTDPKLETGSSLSFGPIFFWTLLAILVIVVVVFLIRFDWAGLKTEETGGKETLVEIETEKIAALPPAVRGKGDLLARAEELANRGLFGEAITFYHSWQLVRFDKLGHIELQSGKTNRAYMGELSGAPKDLRDIFRQSTRLFEDAFYGGLAIDGVAFESVWKNRARLESPLPSLKGHK